ncbi:MAG TPA: HdeA/HdeB family chaperone [Pseudolabrys sp.]|nr:HdeA/HdeB family chaperone [Pseudolabrys sp.]
MKCKVLIVATALSAVAVPSTAQVNLNMNNITCGELLAFSPEGQQFVQYWMSGYYNAAANSSVLNYDRLQKNSAKVLAFCKKNKSKTLPTAIKASAS